MVFAGVERRFIRGRPSQERRDGIWGGKRGLGCAGLVRRGWKDIREGEPEWVGWRAAIITVAGAPYTHRVGSYSMLPAAPRPDVASGRGKARAPGRNPTNFPARGGPDGQSGVGRTRPKKAVIPDLTGFGRRIKLPHNVDKSEPSSHTASRRSRRCRWCLLKIEFNKNPRLETVVGFLSACADRHNQATS